MAEETNKWDGKSRGTPLGYRIFFWLLRTGGLHAAYALLPFVTAWYRWFVPAATRPLRAVYNRLGYAPSEQKKLLRKNLIVFGQTLLDKFALLSGIPHRLTMQHDGIVHLEQLIAAGKGSLLVSAHLGNWEAAGHLLNRLNTRINILMYDGESRQMKALLDKYNRQRSFNIITIQPDLGHIYELSAALRRNELICLHADRFRPGNRTFEIDFLGGKAHFPAGPFLLASKLHAPVSFVMAMKEGNDHYHFFATPARTYAGRGDTGARQMLADYVQLLEEKVKRYPEQWFNYYDFWAARP